MRCTVPGTWKAISLEVGYVLQLMMVIKQTDSPEREQTL